MLWLRLFTFERFRPRPSLESSPVSLKVHKDKRVFLNILIFLVQNCFEHTCSDGGIQLSIDAKKMFGAQEKIIKYERKVLFV